MDIERERRALRQMGERGRADAEEAQLRRDREHRAMIAKTCPYCFHDRHEIETGMWSISADLSTVTQDGPTSVTVLYCTTTRCECGVPPCSDCGRRIDRTITDGVERCPCGEAWPVSPIA